MWIEDLANGKYKYSERYKDAYTDKLKKVSITLNSKSRQAQKSALNELNKKIEHLINTPQQINKQLTFSELVDGWYEYYKKQVRESTYLTTWDQLSTVKQAIGKDTLVYKIDAQLISNTLENFLYGEKDLSNKYVSIMKSKLNLIFRFALKKGYIVDNPIDKVLLEYKKTSTPTKIKDKFLEDSEYKKIIEYTSNHNKRYALLFQWLYLTGMRAGEATALNLDDIDVVNRIAHVNGTLEYRGRRIQEQTKSLTTKTSAGVREVDLPAKCIQLLEEAALLNSRTETDFIFSTSNGTPIQIQAVNTYLRRLKQILKIDKPLSTHIFRHTHVSKLAEIGTPLYAIQDRVGHENSNITESIYLHVTKNVREKLKDDIELL